MTENEPKYIIDSDERAPSLDFDKLINIIRKLLPWITLVFIGAVTISYVYIRYTKPVYESSSVLKLDIKNEVSVLGMNTTEEDQSYKTISSEIELLKSRLFFNKVIKELNLDVTVFTRGSVLVDERYRNSPFNVKYEIKNPSIYDSPIYVEIIDNQKYILSFNIIGKEISGTYHFGETINTEYVKLCLTLSGFYNSTYEDVRLYFLINSDQALVNYLSENLNVQTLNLNANTIKISFRDKNNLKARDLVNSIDTIYLNYTREEKNKANTQKIGFIDEQLGATEQKLNEFENYFENFTIQNRTSDLDVNLRNSIYLLNSIDSEQYQLKSKIARLSQINTGLSKGSEIRMTLFDKQLLPVDLRNDLNEINKLTIQKQILSQSYNPGTEAYKKLDSELRILSGRLKESVSDLINILGDQLAYIERQQKSLERNFLSIPSKSTEYNKIRRYYKLHEDFYLSLMQKRAEFQLALAGTVTDFKILSTANLPLYPLTPQRWMIYGISIVSWFVLSFFLIGIFYLINNKINSYEELEGSTSIPILGSIPFYSLEKLKESKLIIEKDSRSLISESFRSIRTNLQFLVSNKEKIKMTISSSISGEGKSFVAINIAAVLALSSKKIILVDLDLRRPRIHRILGNNNSTGVSTIISNQDKIDDCIKPSGLDNFYFLPAGPTPPNPSELIMSDQFEKLLEYLSGLFDVVILDTPPIGLVTDGVLAMKKSDIQLFVFRGEFSNKQFLKNLEKLHSIHRFSNLAIVLNAVKKTRNLHYGYGSDHGYYSDNLIRKKNPVNL
jgi:tyrosine-protein kinase Etk/Wzc